MKGRILGGRYALDKRIGEGGMGIVYKARDIPTGEIVAVKVIRANMASESRAVKRFFREAEAAGKLNHPGIVRVLGEGTDVEHYLVMEYVEGVTIREWVRTFGRSFKPIVALMGEILAALHHAHSRGIIHRDIKPENVIVTPEGHAKLMDFGLARPMTGSGATITQTGAIVGTVAYMSPEQAGGKRGDERSDLYSLGVVTYELLTGKRPFVGDSPMATLLKHIQEEPQPPQRHNPGIPQALNDVIMKLLAKRPDERYASAASTWEALRRSLDKGASLGDSQMDTMVSEPARPKAPTPEPGRARAAAARLAPGLRRPPVRSEQPPAPQQVTPPALLPPSPRPARPAAVAAGGDGVVTAGPAMQAGATGAAVGAGATGAAIGAGAPGAANGPTAPGGPASRPAPIGMRRASPFMPNRRLTPEQRQSPEPPVEVAVLYTRVQSLNDMLDERSALEALEAVGSYERTVEAIAASRNGRVLERRGSMQVIVFEGRVVDNPAQAAVDVIGRMKQEVNQMALASGDRQPSDLFLSAGVYTGSVRPNREGNVDAAIRDEMLNGARRMHDLSAAERKWCIVCEESQKRTGVQSTAPFKKIFVSGRPHPIHVFAIAEPE